MQRRRLAACWFFSEGQMEMPTPPNRPALTHHEIIRLVEPFARQGRRVDLAASDRAERRIAFKPREGPGSVAGSAPWRETLTLDCRSPGHFVLQRTLVPPDGPAATLCASGPDPGPLLARIEAIAAEHHFEAGPGWTLARSYDTDLPRKARVPAGATPPPLVLTRAELRAGGLTLVLINKLPDLRGVAADLVLAPTSAAVPLPDLPEDLLAVQGWDWARLVRDKQGWTSRLRLRGPVLRRSRTAEAALPRVGAHLARVMAAPPASYHDAHRLARWGVVLRRGIPSLMAILMVAGAMLLPRWVDPVNSGAWMALHYLPIGLLAVAFSLQELARFEIPPWPRRSAAARWMGDAPERAI